MSSCVNTGCNWWAMSSRKSSTTPKMADEGALKPPCSPASEMLPTYMENIAHLGLASSDPSRLRKSQQKDARGSSQGRPASASLGLLAWRGQASRPKGLVFHIVVDGRWRHQQKVGGLVRAEEAASDNHHECQGVREDSAAEEHRLHLHAQRLADLGTARQVGEQEPAWSGGWGQGSL